MMAQHRQNSLARQPVHRHRYLVHRDIETVADAGQVELPVLAHVKNRNRRIAGHARRGDPGRAQLPDVGARAQKTNPSSCSKPGAGLRLASNRIRWDVTPPRLRYNTARPSAPASWMTVTNRPPSAS